MVANKLRQAMADLLPDDAHPSQGVAFAVFSGIPSRFCDCSKYLKLGGG
jgi:uncharacterized membrane protein YraQ (UPF0718 family)